MLTQKQLDTIKASLNEELSEIEEKNREKINEMENEGDSETFHGDEADQANYLEHRSRILRLRDRDRKLINKIRQTLRRKLKREATEHASPAAVTLDFRDYNLGLLLLCALNAKPKKRKKRNGIKASKEDDYRFNS